LRIDSFRETLLFMFSDAYITIKDGDAAALLDGLNSKLDGASFDPVKSRILSHSLSFYPDYTLYEVNDFDNSPSRVVSFIKGKDGLVHILDGTNEVIYGLNQLQPIQLTDDNITIYVRFFFHYVRGRFGRFNIVENIDDIRWREEPSPAGRKALGRMVEPLTLQNKDEEGGYHLKASIIFKDSLFESEVLVKKDGSVSLNNQEMLVEDIPVLDDHFQQ